MTASESNKKAITEQLAAIRICAHQLREYELTHSEKRGLAILIEKLATDTLERIEDMPVQDLPF